MDIKKAQTTSEAGGLDLDHLTMEEIVNIKTGNQLINYIHTSVKAARLYDENNEGFTSQIDKLMDIFESLFESDDTVSLEIYMSYLFFNRVKIKSEFKNYIHIRFIIDTLKKRNTEGLTFSSRLTRAQVNGFIRLLAEHDKEKEIPFEDFQDQIQALHIDNISLQKFSETTKQAAEERLVGIRRQAKRVFFESMYNLKGIMHQGKSKPGTGARRIRRLAQSIVDLIAEDEPYLIGLTTMKHYDDYILNHSVNVCVLSVALGQRVGLEKNALKELGLAGLFHDIGKILQPSEVISEKEMPDDEEQKLLKCHPQYGVEMMMQMKGLGELPVRAMKAILEHHLNFDVSGYPTLSERKKPDLFSRIIAIADHFDVETTPNPSHPEPKTPDQVLLEMMEGKGKAFDPVLLELFVNVIGVYPIGSLVALDSGEVGIVVQPHMDPKLSSRPTVKLIGNGNGHTQSEEVVDLTETDANTGQYARNIAKCLDPWKYNIDVSKIMTQ